MVYFAPTLFYGFQMHTHMKNSGLLENLVKEESKMWFKASNVRLSPIITTQESAKCLQKTFISNLQKFILLRLTSLSG